IGTLAPGAAATLTVAATLVTSVAQGTTVTDTATVTASTVDPVAANNSATASTTASAPEADVSVTKSGTTTALPGQPVTYTVVVANLGPSDATGVAVTDTLGTGLVFVSTDQGGACSATGQ